MAAFGFAFLAVFFVWPADDGELELLEEESESSLTSLPAVFPAFGAVLALPEDESESELLELELVSESGSCLVFFAVLLSPALWIVAAGFLRLPEDELELELLELESELSSSLLAFCILVEPGLAFAATVFLVVFFVLPADELELLESESESESLLLESLPLESVLLVGGDGDFAGFVMALPVSVALTDEAALFESFFSCVFGARRDVKFEYRRTEVQWLTGARVGR